MLLSVHTFSPEYLEYLCSESDLTGMATQPGEIKVECQETGCIMVPMALPVHVVNPPLPGMLSATLTVNWCSS